QEAVSAKPSPLVVVGPSLYEPLRASTVRSAEPTIPLVSRFGEYSEGPTTTSGDGLALTASWNGLAPLVFARVVWPGPAPRKVIPLLINRKLPLLMMNVPAASCTTCPTGQVL